MKQYQITINVDPDALRENHEINSGEKCDCISLEQLIVNEISLDPSLKISEITNTADTLTIQFNLDDARNYLKTEAEENISDDKIRAVFTRISEKSLCNDDVYQTIDAVFQDEFSSR